MPLSKEKMREYQRKRRERQKQVSQVADILVRNAEYVLGEKEPVVQTPLWGSDVVTRKEEEVIRTATFLHTETDAKFEDLSPGYWVYSEDVKERKCWQCGKPYKTRLELNKFCGPKCKEKWLSDAFGKLKGASK